MARTHDGLMMLLMVGRNHALRLDVFYDGCYIFSDGWTYFVWWIVSFTLLQLYHGFNEDDVSSFFSYVYSFKPFIPCDMCSG